MLLTNKEACSLVDSLNNQKKLSKEEWISLIESRNPKISEYVFEKARDIRHSMYDHDVFIRGLIEITNYCKNDCLYCGIRRGNKNARRYRLTKEQILNCCAEGYELGFRTFVLQGGEDPYFTAERMVDIISTIKSKFPDCALTLSVGEKEREEYLQYKEAGADRYLLRHETACEELYKKWHPKDMSLEHRKKCLFELKSLNFQIGAGFMVGAPGQEPKDLAEDMLFLEKLRPDMIGIGPFLAHHDTPFKDEKNGELELTLFMLGLIRIMLPYALIPATTALGTVAADGRERGILAGANVVMPNLSPLEHRGDYLLYDNKISTGEESAQGLAALKEKMESIGYHIVVDRGDVKEKQ